MPAVRERPREKRRPVGVRRIAVPVEVPAAVDMSDANFCRHMNLRHSRDMGGAVLEWEADGGGAYAGTSAALSAYRKFHDRLHSLATPGQYDHEHCPPEAAPAG